MYLKMVKKIASVGALGYSDYPTYMKTKGKAYADERRRLYKIRHSKNRNVKGSDGYYADKLLW
jgi:Mn-dependent DtxR family transcriptional regulator